MSAWVICISPSCCAADCLFSSSLLFVDAQVLIDVGGERWWARMHAATSLHRPKVVTSSYWCWRPGLKIRNVNKNEMYHCASILSATPQPTFVPFVTAFPTIEFLKWWDMTLNLAHLVLVTVRSVSLLQNNYPSHCGPCSLEVCRHLGLSLHPAFLIFRDLFSLASQNQNTSPHIQCPTEVPKTFILLKSCCISKCFWDFPPGKLCLRPCCACPENTQETQYASGRERRCFPHSFISNHQLLNQCSNQLSCGRSQLKSLFQQKFQNRKLVCPI